MRISRDPRGPMREIKEVDMRPDVALLTLSCGHVSRCNQIYMYAVGKPSHCYTCGVIQRTLDQISEPT